DLIGRADPPVRPDRTRRFASNQGGHAGPPLRNPPVRLQSGRTRRSAPTESAGPPPIRADT
ncbi:hypothetical protein RZS08_30050, partial [Arthrospira platensis SPKY1]|nr:hypothetical protein [Arthrospira platensis SPKY1]